MQLWAKLQLSSMLTTEAMTSMPFTSKLLSDLPRALVAFEPSAVEAFSDKKSQKTLADDIAPTKLRPVGILLM